MALPTASEHPTGLHERYHLTKADGTPVDDNAVYFVMRLDNGGSDRQHVVACQLAAMTYAESVIGIEHLDRLGKDLRDLVCRFERERFAESQRRESADNAAIRD